MVLLTHNSALAFWRKDYLWTRIDGQQCRSMLLEKPSRREIEDVIDAIRPIINGDLRASWPSEDSPLHLMIGAGVSPLRRMEYCQWRTWSNSLPAGSMYELISATCGARGRPFLITSPELTFLMLANGVSWPNLLMLAYELCGTYRLDPISPYGFWPNRPQLCTPKSLLRFIERYGKGVHGVGNARMVARYVIPNAASPRESVLSALLTLSRSYGGQGLPAPELNGELKLGTEARLMAGKGKLVIDVLWRKQGVGLEYDSRAFHSVVDPMKVESDKHRINAAKHEGIDLITVTNDQLKDRYIFHAIVKSIMRRAGWRKSPTKERFLRAEDYLRHELLAKSIFGEL